MLPNAAGHCNRRTRRCPPPGKRHSIHGAASFRATNLAYRTRKHDTIAIYYDATRTIYLPEGWTGDTPAELSVIVHEVVHHFQNVLRLKYECPQEREKLAYIAQEIGRAHV